MKKSTAQVAILVLTIFSLSQIASAQLINYERRNKILPQGQSASLTTPTTKQTSQYNQKAYQEQVQEKVSEKETLVKVTNRVERVYDSNRDGELTNKEIQEFYRDVISSVSKKGNFKVSSDILKEFDSNNDGVISSYEVSAITKALN